MSGRGDEPAYPASTTTLAVPGHEHTETVAGFTKREVEMIEYRKAALTAIISAEGTPPLSAATEQGGEDDWIKDQVQTAERYARAMYAAAHPEDQDDG